MNKIPSILAKIVERKKGEVEALYSSGWAERYRRGAIANPSKRDFEAAITKPGINLIAEFKQASPSKGDIRPGANPEEIGKVYEDQGAAAISVLTDSGFKGEIDHLCRMHHAVSLPVLRKDFMIDEAQIHEARAKGADAILLIAAILEPQQIEEYIAISRSFAMDCLVESHNEEDLEKAIQGKAEIFGINNRDLNTFETDRSTTLRLIKKVPAQYPVVTESGIHMAGHVKEITHPRVNAMLVGESIMSKEANPTLDDMRQKIQELLNA